MFLRTQLRSAAFAMVACAIIAAASGCGGPAQPTPAPTITLLSPSTAKFGDTITITGTGFLETGNSLKIGGGYFMQSGTSSGDTVRFVVSETAGACPATASVCITIAVVVPAGRSDVSVVNANGTSNTVTLQLNAR